MSDHIVVLDSCYFTKKDGGTCILRGWMYIGYENKPFAQARADREEVWCELRQMARPDVRAARPDLPFVNDQVGFEIRIPGMEALFERGGDLRVRIVSGEGTYPVLEKSVSELHKMYQDSTLLINLDHVKKQDRQIIIQGWCVDFDGKKMELHLQEDDGTELTDLKIKTSKREDVVREYGVTHDMCLAFEISLERKAIRSDRLHLVFFDGSAQAETVIDLKRFDRENTRAYRLRKLVGRSHWKENKKQIKDGGFFRFCRYLWEESSTFDSYFDYAKQHAASKRELKEQAKELFSPAPLFSIVVPLYETPLVYLQELLDSVCAQSYQNWELCLADGSKDSHLGDYIKKHYRGERRIRYRHLKENTGISGNTNAALSMAEGEYLVFADHDDTLEPDALYLAAKEFAAHPELELLYTDEDLMDENGGSFYPHFKPDYNPELLRCINYICHLLVIRRSLYERVGGLRSEFDGAQDYDFLLRCTEQTEAVGHLPKVLYHWRSHPGSTAGNQESKQYAVDASIHALEEHYRRLGIDAEVEYTGTFIVLRSKFPVKGDPKVSILIPNKDHIGDLDKCITSVEEKSTYRNIEIIVIENNSEEAETFRYYEELKNRYPNVQVVTWEGPFNYSAINNFGAGYASGDFFLLLNNDTEVISPDWLERMISLCQREKAGIVGAKLYYPDDTIQHAGIVIGIGGFAGHIQTGYTSLFTGYLGRLITTQEISAVTGACMLVKRSVYEKLDGLDEVFTVALNDVDFCLRARELGYRIYFTPDAQLYHYESKSRGLEDDPVKQERFDREIAQFQSRHRDALEAGDPYYNPNLTLMYGDCSVRKNNEILKKFY